MIPSFHFRPTHQSAIKFAALMDVETRRSANADWRQGGAVHVVQNAPEEGSIVYERAMSQSRLKGSSTPNIGEWEIACAPRKFSYSTGIGLQ